MHTHTHDREHRPMQRNKHTWVPPFAIARAASLCPSRSQSHLPSGQPSERPAKPRPTPPPPLPSPPSTGAWMAGASDARRRCQAAPVHDAAALAPPPSASRAFASGGAWRATKGGPRGRRRENRRWNLRNKKSQQPCRIMGLIGCNYYYMDA